MFEFFQEAALGSMTWRGCQDKPRCLHLPTNGRWSKRPQADQIHPVLHK